MLGHPGRLRGCSVRRVRGLGCPGHLAECSAAPLPSTPFELSMPVPGQPNPLDLHENQKQIPQKFEMTPWRSYDKSSELEMMEAVRAGGRYAVDIQQIYILLRKKRLPLCMCISLTWILLVLERLHPLLLAQRPLRPGLSSLVPHLAPLDSHLKYPEQPAFSLWFAPSAWLLLTRQELQHFLCTGVSSNGQKKERALAPRKVLTLPQLTD